ncbi:MAG: hypothetical protein CM15mP83_4460 [Flavobacteriaceae bacterium]|nr:MAG: hypothetical protein CM15mP83_4460 [Flavobacteriaceae bacterium]
MNVLYRGLPNEIRVIDPEIQQSNMILDLALRHYSWV